MKKISYPVKIQFLSFTREDIPVVMATSVSANEIYWKVICKLYESYMKVICFIAIIFRIHINATYFLYLSTKTRMCVRSIFY